MSDNLNNRGPQDRARVNIHEAWEVRYWAKAFGVTEGALQALVQKHGVLVADIERAVGRRANHS